MKKLSVLLWIILLVGIIVGCTRSTAAEESQPTITTPWITPRTISQPDDTIQILPKIKLGNVFAGVTADTWTDSAQCTANPDLSIKKGGIMTLDIYNGYPNDVAYLIYYHPPVSKTTDADTGLEYTPAPQEAKNWIEIANFETTSENIAEIFSVSGPSTIVTIPAYSIAHIPVKFSIPRDAKNLPKRWEFDIRVSGIGFITTACDSRWLITMR